MLIVEWTDRIDTTRCSAPLCPVVRIAECNVWAPLFALDLMVAASYQYNNADLRSVEKTGGAGHRRPQAIVVRYLLASERPIRCSVVNPATPVSAADAKLSPAAPWPPSIRPCQESRRDPFNPLMKISGLKICLFVLLSSLDVSGKEFFGQWSPPESLAGFWAPLDESWWSPSDNTRIVEYCRRYAENTDAQVLIKEIVQDLKVHPSVERTWVYSMLVIGWDTKVTLPILRIYYKSKDPIERTIAGDFIADIEEVVASGLRSDPATVSKGQTEPKGTGLKGLLPK